MLERTFEPSLPRRAKERSSPLSMFPDSTEPHSFLFQCDNWSRCVWVVRVYCH